MWLLLPENDTAEGNEKMRLLTGCQYTVGRQNCDFLITNDKSISRCHATLSITHSEIDVAHPHKIPVLKIKDESKFGTEIQGERIKKEERPVKSGTRVKFGTVSSIYKVVYEPYVVSTSCLNQAPKKQTKTLMAQLGGHVVSDWRPECQLLIMSNLSVTVKVICALVSLKSIVTVQYLEEMIRAVKAKKEMPDPNDFTPPLAESQLNPAEVSFKEDERRKTLLQGKVFIFLNPIQFKKLNLAVGLAGGKPVLMEEGTDDNKDDILVEDSSCVMQCDPTDPTQQLSENAQDWINHVFRVLAKNGRRPIPDSELGYAVLYCSTERYCNPSASASSSQFGTLPSQSLSQMAPPTLAEQVDGQESVQPSTSVGHTTAQNGHRNRNGSRKSIKPKVEAVGPAAAKVKEEPLSQSEAQGPMQAAKKPNTVATSTISSFFNRKRKKDSAGDEPTAKLAKKIIDVKEEPVTPQKSEAASSRTTERRVSPRRSPSPTTSPCPKVGTGASKRPTSPRRGRSPSPKVGTGASKRPTSPRRGRSPSPRAAETGASKRPTSPRRGRSPSPRAAETGASKRPTSPRRGRSPSPRAAETGASKRPTSPRRGRSPSPRVESLRHPKIEESEEEEDIFDEFNFKQKPQQRIRSPEARTKPTGRPSTSANQNSSRHRLNNGVKGESSPSHQSEGPDSVQSSEVKVEDQNDVKDIVRPTNPASSLRKEPLQILADEDKPMFAQGRTHDGGGDVPTGFLRAGKPQQQGAGPFGDGHESDPDIPKDAGMVTVVKDLVARQLGAQRKVPAENNNVNGNHVKNFKKFRKVHPAGATGLPRIIGGSDLVVHAGTQCKEVDDWMNEQRIEESQQNEVERISEEIFRYVPPSKKKGNRR